jgi:hypothetical protein
VGRDSIVFLSEFLTDAAKDTLFLTPRKFAPNPIKINLKMILNGSLGAPVNKYVEMFNMLSLSIRVVELSSF